MKQKYLLLYLLCLFTAMPFGAKAQSTMTYTLNFDPSDFTINRINGDTSIITSTKYDIYSNYDPTQPELPVIYVTYLLPPGKSYVGFSYTKGDAPFQPGVILINGSKPLPTNQGQQTLRTLWYPSQIYSSGIEFVKTISLTGYQMVIFKVEPIRYDAIHHDLMVASFDITIQLTEMEMVEPNNYELGTRVRSFVEERIWNRDSLVAWYQPQQLVSPVANDGLIPKDRYLIITQDSLKAAFQPLIDWKRTKGLDASIVSVDSIYRQFTFHSDMAYSSKIKHFLKQQYENINLQDRQRINFYVLLGGDVEIVPTAMCKYPLDDSWPCDMYYACVSDQSWNWTYNNSGIIDVVTIKDSIRYFNDIYVSRASVRDINQVNIFVNKIIQYETNPPIDLNWGDTILFLGHQLYHEKLEGNMYHDDVELYGRATIDSLNSYNWNGCAKYLFSTANNLGYSDLKPNDIWKQLFIDSVRTIEQLNKNYSIIEECSHGSFTTWVGGSSEGGAPQDTFFEYYMIDSIHTSFPKLIITSSCKTNNFALKDDIIDGETLCLGELFMRAPQSGIAAYIGSSYEGYDLSYVDFEKGNYFQNSNKINMRFIKALYDSTVVQNGYLETKNLAKVVDYAKRQLTIEDDSENSLMFSVNTLGDPEMPIYTMKPKLFNNVTFELMHFDANDLEDKILLVNTEGIEGTRLYLITEDKLYEPNADNGYAIYTESDSIEFVLMKQNYIPLHVKIFRTRYIQNETIQNNTMYTSNYDYIYVGRNVTSELSEGPVSVVSGKKLELKAKKGVMIKNSFEVSSGSEFIMDVEQ